MDLTVGVDEEVSAGVCERLLLATYRTSRVETGSRRALVCRGSLKQTNIQRESVCRQDAVPPADQTFVNHTQCEHLQILEPRPVFWSSSLSKKSKNMRNKFLLCVMCLELIQLISDL